MQRFLVDRLEKKGIRINGDDPWDIQVHNQRFYMKVMLTGTLGIGESYVDGDWDCDNLDELARRFLMDTVHPRRLPEFRGLPSFFAWIKAFFINLSTRSNSVQVADKHYNIGNDIYESMLDKYMCYTCAYWKNTDNLEQAQENKLELICRKLKLEPGLKVLNIGAGWGGFSRYAAKKYQVEVTNISNSKEQIAYAINHREIAEKNLRIDYHCQDYRDITGMYDRIVSIGMVEHVGRKNYTSFMKKVASHLKDDGLFLLQTIGATESRWISDPWINRYIFPNSMLPSALQITRASEKYFVMEDWHNFGSDYDKTLMAWYANFERSWPDLASKYGQRFYRMWRYYLLTCAGSFRARYNQLWQIVFSKNGLLAGYESVR